MGKNSILDTKYIILQTKCYTSIYYEYLDIISQTNIFKAVELEPEILKTEIEVLSKTLKIKKRRIAII